MLKKLLFALAVVFGILVVVILLQPSEFSVERHTTVNAPAAVVHEQINDFHKWAAWSPWEKMEDPADLKKTYSGAESGNGASYAWEGKKTGQGTMTITNSKPGEVVDVDLVFLAPMKAENKVAFNMKPAGEGTEVSWRMSGHKNFVSKAFGLVMDMDKMVGPDFEKGLEGLKTVAEAESKKALEAAKAAQEAAAAAAAAAAAPAGADATDAGAP